MTNTNNIMTKDIDLIYEQLEEGSVYESNTYDKTYCAKLFLWLYFVVSPIIALICLIIAALGMWGNDDLNTGIVIGTSLYIMCHWGCYVLKHARLY